MSWDDEFLIIVQILCIIVRCEDPAFSFDLSPAAIRAEHVIETYRTEGLLPNLSDDQVRDGLAAAQAMRHHLQYGRGTPGTLGFDRAAQLDVTMASMIAELESLRSHESKTGV